MAFCIPSHYNCDRGISFCNAIAKNQRFFAYFALPCLLPKGDTQPKAKICSKRQDLVFAVTLLEACWQSPKTKYPAEGQNMIQTWRFSVCCDHFWKTADKLQKPNILPKTKIWSKDEDLVFAVITFGSLLTTSKNQISCRRPKYDPNLKI